MKKNHTAGEWKHFFNGNYFEVKGVDLLKPNISIFKIGRIDHPDMDEMHICEYEETEANAKLIAAAPDMFESINEWLALKVKYVTGIALIDANNKIERAAIVKVMEAIKKATS